ncbi:MAG: hypothetical protein AAGH87_04855 [Pseudomonadota bacterium]
MGFSQAMSFGRAAPGGASLIDRPAGAVSWRVWSAWLALFGAYSMILPRDASYDVVHYHLYLGWAFTEGRLGRDFAPADMHSFLNPYWQALVWQALDHMPGRVAAFFLGALQGLTLPVLYALARRVLAAVEGSPPRALVVWAVAVSGFLAAPQILLMGSIRNDALTCLVFLAALTALFPPGGGAPRLGILALASAGLGLVFGLKPTNAVYVLGFAAAAGTLFIGQAGGWQRLGVCAAAGALGTALGAGPWAWHLWSQFGNPLFPMANHVFGAPLGPEESFRDARYLPASLVDGLTWPFQALRNGALINEYSFFDPRFPLAYLAALFMAGLAMARRDLPRPALALALATLATLAAWTAVFSILRYGMAVWSLGPLLVATAIAACRPGALCARRAGLYAMAGALALMSMTQTPGVRRVAWSDWAGPYVQVSVPAQERYEGAVIVFAGDVPSAFTAMGFPDTATFTHAAPAPWSAPALAKYRQAQVRPLIETGRPLFAVITVNKAHFPRTVARLASGEGLSVETKACARLPTSFDAADAHWRVCPMEPIQ